MSDCKLDGTLPNPLMVAGAHIGDEPDVELGAAIPEDIDAEAASSAHHHLAPKLELLDLSGNRLDSPPLIDALSLLHPFAPNLQTLRLDGNKLGGMLDSDPISGYSRLRALSLRGMGLHGDVSDAVLAALCRLDALIWETTRN